MDIPMESSKMKSFDWYVLYTAVKSDYEYLKGVKYMDGFTESDREKFKDVIKKYLLLFDLDCEELVRCRQYVIEMIEKPVNWWDIESQKNLYAIRLVVDHLANCLVAVKLNMDAQLSEDRYTCATTLLFEKCKCKRPPISLCVN